MPNANENKTMGIGGIAGAVTGLYGIAQNAFGIGEKRQDQRQIEQQQKLTDQQIKANKELADYSQGLQMKMWNDTNYEAQKKHMEAAGLNPGLMYGMSGGGGTTTGSASAGNAGGGQAANSAATQQANTAMGIQMAQMALMAAQAEKTKAETEEIRGTKIPKGQAETTGVEFQNKVNEMIGAGEMAENYKWATDRLATQSQKEMAEYEAWVQASFEGKPTDDANSPIAKAMRAGLDKTMEELKQAKLNNDATEASNIVKRFEANLAENGIHPQSPWWVKIVGDLLAKAGITTMIQAGASTIKQ